MTASRVAALSLAQFRSYRSLDLAFDGRPVVLTGPNGAGKTNLLEAVSLLSPGRGLRRAPLEDLARRPQAIGWRVGATLEGDAAHEVDLRVESGTSRSVRIDGKAATQAALGGLLRVLWLVPAMDRLWIEGAEGRRRFLDRAAMSFRPGHGEAVLGYDRALRERNRLLRDGIREPGWFAALEARMGDAGAAMTAGRRHAIARLNVMQAAPDFPTTELALADDGFPDTSDEITAILAAGRRHDGDAGRTLAGPHRADLAATYAEKGVPAAQCSTGEQKALLVALLLANARAVATDAGATPILLLDEVSAHLDAHRRGSLYDAIAGLGAQAFLTGTEPGLFAGLAASILAVTDTGDGSRIAPAHEGPDP